MKCLFVHDFRSYKRNGEFYTTNLSYEILKERYVNNFGELEIINRSGIMPVDQAESGFVKASGENIKFVDTVEIFTPSQFAKKYRKIKKAVIDSVNDNDFVIIRLDSFLGLIAAEYCRKINKKYLVEVVGCVWDSFWNKGVLGKIVALPLYSKMRYEIKQAKYVVYVTREFLQNRYPTQGYSTNISNVQLNNIDNEILNKRLSRISDKDDDSIINIVTVASVEVRYKGQESVIYAIHEMKKRGYKNYIYHLIGGGDNSFLVNLCKKLNVTEQIVFHGSMNHDEVMCFLEDCDIYIQPSKQEGLPRALIEGMSKGLLCIGTKVAGIPELLDSNYIVSKKNTNYLEIADLLQRLTSKEYVEQAVRNYEEAQQYEAHILDDRRKQFMKEFKDS